MDWAGVKLNVSQNVFVMHYCYGQSNVCFSKVMSANCLHFATLITIVSGVEMCMEHMNSAGSFKLCNRKEH